MSFRFLAAVGSLLLAPSAAGAQDVDVFSARSFKGANGVTMPYRLFIPSAEARKKALPLVVYLHGSGGIGDDNLKQISGGNAPCVPWAAPSNTRSTQTSDTTSGRVPTWIRRWPTGSSASGGRSRSSVCAPTNPRTSRRTPRSSGGAPQEAELPQPFADLVPTREI